ncbi:MAG: hypothetical protein JAZ02_07540 [Candidatus Thiodiazotropha endolucinida]|nr:hypothetical protein [Candidatus Thiodiazotropha endolucinida]
MSESNATAVSMVNRRARDLALQAMRETGVEATSLVNYQSRGRVAVIGDQTALEIAPRLNDKLSPQECRDARDAKRDIPVPLSPSLVTTAY